MSEKRKSLAEEEKALLRMRDFVERTSGDFARRVSETKNEAALKGGAMAGPTKKEKFQPTA